LNRRFLLALFPVIGLLVAVSAAQPPAQQPEPLQEPVYVFGTTVVIPSGLKGVIYYISRAPKDLAEIEKDKPRGTIYASSLNIPTQDYKLGFPGITKRFEWFAIDYTGKFWINQPGEYRWELTSDDGAMLYIDGQQVIDNGGLHPPVTLHGTTRLSEGIHTIRVPYFQGLKFQVALILKIAGPGQEFRVFSTEEFKPPATWVMPETPAK
jgi:hypothetical protein